MIKRSELRPVGTLLKTHGIDGEIVVQLTADVDLEALQCIVLEIDGIFVPFFPTSVRPKSAETDLVSIAGVETQQQAAAVCGHKVYALVRDLDKQAGEGAGEEGDGMYADDLIGFDVRSDGEIIGKITDFDDSTANYLFIIERRDAAAGQGPLLVPVALVEGVDPEACVVDMEIPRGLLEL